MVLLDPSFGLTEVFMETRLLEASAADAGKRFDAYLSKRCEFSEQNEVGQ